MAEILEKFKVIPKQKAQMHAPLCKMIPMHAFDTDILKMEQAIHMGYKEGDKGFYLFSTNWKGEEKDVSL